jgi:hypothetical protein
MDSKVSKQDRIVNAMPVLAMVILLAVGAYMYFF